MNANIVLLSGRVTLERLAWIEESLKFYFVQLFPETLMHPKTSESPVFIFFLTGDALYSLADPELLQAWHIILSFNPVRIICDHEELELRGISAGPLRMRFPDQVMDTNTPDDTGRPSFWQDLISAARPGKPAVPGTLGWFQTGSPYQHRSSWHGLRFLSAAIGGRLSAELYAYLDGVHLGHHGQRPTDAENIGEGIVALHSMASSAGLTFSALACGRCATARGYNTWDDGKGSVISTCTVRPFRIRDLTMTIDRFLSPHVILAPDAGAIPIRRQGPAVTFDRAEKASRAPPVTILVTRSPYTTEYAIGAVLFGIACAHAGILTRVVFLEEGIYALTGTHRQPESSPVYNIQEIINRVAGSENLHFFALTPSFQRRGTSREKALNAVIEIGYPGLGKILFYPPGNVQAEHQRVLIF